MANYTKGKWEVGNFSDKPFARSLLSVYREDGRVIAMAMTPYLIPFQEAEANAHLIAAAPDLYEALKKILDSGVIYPGGGFEALAKAEGKA